MATKTMRNRKPTTTRAGTKRKAGDVRRTKAGIILDFLRQPKSATIAELQEATGWQAHSVRGALSGTVKKKLGLDVSSEVIKRRGRVYRIVNTA